MKGKFASALSLALILAMLFTSIGFADNLVNDIQSVGDSTITAGGSTVIAYKINGTGGDGQSGCNASDGSPATVTLSVPPGVTASTSSLTFTACNVFQDVTFSASSAGNYAINVSSISDSGAGSYKNEANFTLYVSAPADNTVPTATPTQSPAANANGWNNTDVVVSWNWSDNLGGSGIDSTSCTTSSTSSGEGTLTLTATCKDKAGNLGNASYTVYVDKKAPTASASASPAANAAGWNNTDVIVSFSGSDSLSGIASCSDPVTLSTDGSGQSASGTCSDKAGNVSAPASVSGINIDRTAPNTTATAPANWNNTDVTVTLNAADALSGVSATYYTLDGGAAQTGTSLSISTEGDHTLQFWSVDKAGNIETAKTVQVKIDKTSPTINHTQSPTANANGWNNTDVTFTFVCADSMSGIASCTGPQTVTTEGKDQAVTGTATDNAGNTATDPATVSIDKTAPFISSTQSPAANPNGWNNTDVTVLFTCTDGLSGVASCPASQTVTTEGKGQPVTGTATDAAGNQATASASVSIDKTKPTISAAATTSPNQAGWYNGNVTVHFTCSDDGSGIPDGACPADQVLSAEGASVSSAAVTVIDAAGNVSEPSNVVTVKIDKTAPTISAAATTAPNAADWYNSNVTVHFTCKDDGSGIPDGACPQDQTLSTEGNAVSSIAMTVTDAAGNTSDPSNVVIVKIDKTAPTISASASPAPNEAGWNNTDVTVEFTCSDVPSGIASCTPAVTLSTDGADQSANGTAVDLAGNSASTTINGINIDKTAPSVSLVGGPANGGTYYFGFVPATPTCSASDALSGLVGACSVTGYSNALGSHTVSASVTDKAGNSASASATYSVLAWTLKGFYQPVDMNNVYNVVKNGSTVPLKFEIFAGPTELTDVVQVKSLTYAQTSCDLNATTDDIETVATGNTVLRYDATSGQFIYNWKTPSTAGKCYRVTMTAQDGSFLQAYFKLK